MSRRLQRYHIRFEHDHGWSEARLRAPSAQAALKIALRMDSGAYEWVASYDADDTVVSRIHVDPVACPVEPSLLWRSAADTRRDAADHMHRALRAAETAIETATDILSGMDGQPLHRLAPWQIEQAFHALAGVMVGIDEALRAAEQGGVR